MRKAVVFLLVITAFVHAASAQAVEWSNQQKVKPRNNYTQIVGENASGIYMLRSKNNEYSKDLIIEKYKGNLAIDKSLDFWQPAGSYLERVLMSDNGLIAIGSMKNNATGFINLFYWKIDENLNSTQELFPLLKVEADKFRDKNVFYIRQNADRSATAVMYLTKAAENAASVLRIYGFDQLFAQKYAKQYPLAYEVGDIFVTSIECDNAGNVFTLIDFPREKAKRKAKADRRFLMYAFMSAEQNLLEYELGKDSIMINELGLVVNNYNKSVAVAGFYNKPGEKKLEGSFLYTVNISTTKNEVNVFEPFDKTFVNRVAGTMLNETTAALTDLYIRKLIPRSDGGCVIVGEKYYETNQSYTYYVNGFPQTAMRTVFNYDEIIVLSKKGDGTTQYNEFFKKNQSSMTDGGYYSSFVVVNTNDKLNFIYNADVTTEGDVMISSITPRGITDTRVLIKSMSYYVSLMPPESKQVSVNSSLICTLKDRRFSIMRLRF